MARSKNKNVGLIGLGIIGSAVAAALRNRGLQVFVWNRTPRPEQNFVGSPTEVAELCDVIQIFVADDEALLEIVRQLTPGLTAQHIVTAHCTVAPESMRAAAAIVERRGARFIEAPFTGSKVAAESGQLVYYIGGDEAALKQARPVLEASSKEIIVIGKIGDASVIKVATNLVTAATAQIAAEALALVRKAGISPELFGQAMKSNASNSATLEMKLPLMLAGDFEPRFSVKHMLKDVRIAGRLAREYSLELPVAEVASDMLLAQLKDGRGDADYSSVAQKYFPAPEVVVRPEPPKPPQLPLSAKPAFGVKEAHLRTEVVPETKSPAPAPEAIAPPDIITESVVETKSIAAPPEVKESPPIAPEPIIEAKPIAAAPQVKDSPPIVAEPVAEAKLKPIVAAPEVKASPLIAAKSVAETKPTLAPPEVKESSPTAAEPMIEAKPVKRSWIDDDEDEEEEMPEGVNLSGGIRGWLSRRFSGSRRKS
jgi:3-hydroxyisobutyrate dehydrogenase-like beta-hydroxyacid dehydrogenase